VEKEMEGNLIIYQSRVKSIATIVDRSKQLDLCNNSNNCDSLNLVRAKKEKWKGS